MMCRAPVAWMRDEPFGFDDSKAPTHNKIHLSAVSSDRIFPNPTTPAAYGSNRHEVTYESLSNERRY